MGVNETVTGSGDRGPGARVAGTVLEERPSAVYRVRLENRHEVLAHLVGAVERNFVRLVPGDRVEVALAPHDPTRARITRKLAADGVFPGPQPLNPGPEEI